MWHHEQIEMVGFRDMHLPAPIANFFRMKNEHDDDGLWSLFAEDAMVVDGGEGRTLHGAAEIQKWIQNSISGLNLHTDVRGCTQRGGEWVLETVVTGDFKASPARFEYFITLDRDKISSLRVEFRGSLKG
jgi:hypothetical protein